MRQTLTRGAKWAVLVAAGVVCFVGPPFLAVDLLGWLFPVWSQTADYQTYNLAVVPLAGLFYWFAYLFMRWLDNRLRLRGDYEQAG